MKENLLNFSEYHQVISLRGTLVHFSPNVVCTVPLCRIVYKCRNCVRFITSDAVRRATFLFVNSNHVSFVVGDYNGEIRYSQVYLRLWVGLYSCVIKCFLYSTCRRFIYSLDVLYFLLRYVHT